MFRTALKSVIANKVRFALSGLAIVLGVSLVAGTFVFTDTIGKQFDGLFSDIYEGVDVTVRSASELAQGDEPFAADIIDDIRAVDGVLVASGDVSNFSTQILDKEGNPFGGQGPPVLGFSWGEEPSLSPVRIGSDSGRPPDAPGEVALDANTAMVAGFVLGDNVTVVSQDGPEMFTLVGIMNFGDSDTLLGATLSAFDLAEARRLFGLPGQFTEIRVSAAEGVTPEELTSRIDVILPEGIEAVTGEVQKNEEVDTINNAIGFINIALLAFAGVSVFVGAFIIQNTFRIIVTQRTRELALLRAIGATAGQVNRTVVTEALVIGLIGSIVGLGLGFVMAIGIRGILNTAGLAIPSGSLTLEPRTVVVALLVGTLLTLGSAVLPARRASRVPPIAALRTDLARPARKSLRNRSMAGGALATIGVVALVYGLFGGPTDPLIWVATGAVLLFLGVAVLAPLAASPLATLVGALATKISGITGHLARENTRRSPRRTAATAAALMVGVALVVFVAVFGSSTKTSVANTVDDLFLADLTLQSTIQGTPEIPSPIPDSIRKSLSNIPEVGIASGVQFGSVIIDRTTEVIAAIDPSTIGAVLNIDPIGNALSALDQSNKLIVRHEVMESRGWQLNQVVPVEFAATGIVDLELAGTFESGAFGDTFISTDTYAANFTQRGDGVLLVSAADGVTVAALQVAVQQVTDPYAIIDVQTQSELISSARGQIDQALLLLNALLLMSVIIAVLGIVNTLALSIFERTREIGLLRAVGMTQRQVRQMVRWESVMIALFGAILGVTVGIFLGWAVVRALADEGLGAFSVPYLQVVGSFVLAAMAGGMAAIWPARKAAKLNILEAISHN